MLDSINRVSSLAELFSLLVRHAGARPFHGTFSGQATAYVALLIEPASGRVCVLMTDGGWGVSLTNAAEEITAYVIQQHLAVRGIDPDQVLWIYRDGEGHWDEMVVSCERGASVRFIPLGARRQADVKARLLVEGFTLDEVDLRCLTNYLKLDV